MVFNKKYTKILECKKNEKKRAKALHVSVLKSRWSGNHHRSAKTGFNDQLTEFILQFSCLLL